MSKPKARRRSKTDGLSKAELKLIAELLDMANNEFGNHGCNDYAIPATDENKDIMREIITDTYDKRDVEESLEEVDESKDELSVMDVVLFDYFAQRCKKLAEKK